jgi:hypothetical protein
LLLPLHNFKRYFIFALTGLLCCIWSLADAQFFTLDGGRTQTIPFQLVRNLVVIKVKINNKGPYNFILDTGVGFMVITDPLLVDSINIITKRTVKITGLGEGKPYEAYVTPPLKVDIDGLVSHNISAVAFKEDSFGLSNYTGLAIHGLLGHDFFNNLAVKISFTDSIILVADPKKMRFYKRGIKIPITIEDKKPHFTTRVVFADGTESQKKLIIDLGAGHFLSLENIDNKNDLQKISIPANLGMSLNGLIKGTLSRIKEIDIGKYRMKNVITSFPDYDNLLKMLSANRDGNLGMAMLKKFDIIFNYPDRVMYLKPGLTFKKKDEHDMSGLIYLADVRDDLQHIIIHQVEPGTAGEEAGLLPQDEIVAINFKPVYPLSMQQIDNLFRSAHDRTLVLGIFRNGKYINVMLTLKRRI